MEVMIIEPPYSCLKGFTTSRGYNLGPTSVAAYLELNGVHTGVVTGDLLAGVPGGRDWLVRSMRSLSNLHEKYIASLEDHPVWDRLRKAIWAHGPQIVGIQYQTPMKLAVDKTARIAKELSSSIKVVVGCSHPTFRTLETMENPDFDFAIIGEGELPMLALVNELHKARPDFSTVPGLAYRDADGKVQVNPMPLLVSNLDNLPFPARHCVLGCDYSKYRVHMVLTARGCPYNCSFCTDNSFWQGKVRRRSVRSVVAELVYLQNTYPISDLDIADGTFTYDKHYVEEFCELMVQAHVKLRWRCTARYDNISPTMLKQMKRAGCTTIYLGFESGSDRILDMVDKRMNLAKILEASEMAKQSGLVTVNSVLMGLPGETEEDMKVTIETMKKLKTDLYDVNTFMPLPGSTIYNGLSEGEKRGIDWARVSMKSVENYFNKGVPHSTCLNYLNQAFDVADSVKKRTIRSHVFRAIPSMVLNAVKMKE